MLATASHLLDAQAQQGHCRLLLALIHTIIAMFFSLAARLARAMSGGSSDAPAIAAAR